MIKKLTHIILWLLIIPFATRAQADAEYFMQKENEIVQKMNLVLGAPTELERTSYADTVYRLLTEVLQNENSFYYPFNIIKKRISVVQFEDEIKIFTFTTTTAKDKHIYRGIIQWYNPKTKQVQLIELNDTEKLNHNDINKTFSNNKWYGALYYKIIRLPKMNKNQYVVLGWDGNDLLTNRKIIDVITIGSNGNVKFGYPVLKTEQNRTAKRLIFEYGDEVVMSLKWEPEYNAIVFDYLVPLSDQFHGVWAYYGPSLNRFDALIYNKGKWTYKKDLDIKLHKTIKDKFYKSPK
tara:strand:- start:36962 stop:37840 length:879 start_codon:yes stop_codon:yes gene_type:complete